MDGAYEISLNVAVAQGGWHCGIVRSNSSIILGHLLSPCVVRTEAFPYGRRRYAAHRIFCGGIQERATADFTVDVTVEYIQKFLRIIRCFLSSHKRPAIKRSGAS